MPARAATPVESRKPRPTKQLDEALARDAVHAYLASIDEATLPRDSFVSGLLQRASPGLSRPGFGFGVPGAVGGGGSATSGPGGNPGHGTDSGPSNGADSGIGVVDGGVFMRVSVSLLTADRLRKRDGARHHVAQEDRAGRKAATELVDASGEVPCVQK